MTFKVGIAAFVLGLVFLSCEKNGTVPPDENLAAELAKEGWAAYIQGDYTTAATKFSSAMSQDVNLVEAYTGEGWASAKMNYLSVAVSNFITGLSKDSANLDIMAGLAFVTNAQKDYEQSISRALEVLSTDSGWAFRHDPTLNTADLRLLMAENYFALASYALSLQQVQLLNPQFTVSDIASPASQAALAQEIERLRTII